MDGEDDCASPSGRTTSSPANRETASLISRAVFAWVRPFLGRAHEKTQLDHEDLVPLPKDLNCETNAERFEFELKDCLDAVNEALLREKEEDVDAVDAGTSKKKKKKKKKSKKKFLPAITKPIWSCFGNMILTGAMYKLANDVLQFLPPVILSGYLKYVAGAQDNFLRQTFTTEQIGDTELGVLYCALMLFVQVSRTLCEQQYFYHMQASGIVIKGALGTSVYRKTVRLNASGRSGSTTGEVLNHMQLDAQRVGDLMLFLNIIWSGLFQIIGYITLLYMYIGWSVFGGFFLLIALIPLQKFFYTLAYKLRSVQTKYTDRRVKLENEGLSGVKILKLNAWEDSLEDEVKASRKEEMVYATKTANVAAANTSIMLAGPVIVAVVVFTLYAGVMNGEMRPDIIFPALTLFSLIRFPVMFYPRCLALSADAIVSLDRLQKYFLLSESKPTTTMIKLEDLNEGNGVNASTTTPPEKKRGDLVAKIKKGVSFRWSKSSKNSNSSETVEIEDDASPQGGDGVTAGTGFTLSKCDFEIKRGELVCVVGAVGSGKTAIVSALLGDMVPESSIDEKHNSDKIISINGTVAYCSQSPWVQSASVKENILFGKAYFERKYHDTLDAACMLTDLKLLPDADQTQIGEKGITLSGGQKQRCAIARAVYADADFVIMDDPLSALDAHVAKDVFNKCVRGVFREKAVLLITHQLHFVERADTILVMKDGEVVERGSYEELIENAGYFRQMMESYRGTQEKEMRKTEEQAPEAFSLSEKDRDQMKSVTSEQNLSAKTAQKEEHREQGAVKKNVYITYFKALGGIVPFTILMLITITERMISVFTPMWLAYWTEYKYGLNDTEYMSTYAAIGIVSALLSWVRTFAFLVASLRAATTLHLKLFHSVLNTRQAFFDTTPLGRIIQRFAKDTNVLDNLLGQSVSSLTSFGLWLLATMIAMVIIIPILGPFLVPVFACYFYVQYFYRPGYREAKRLDGTSGSPIFEHFGETISGISTIRAFGHQERFIQENEKRIAYNQRADYTQKCACDRWLPVRLEIIGISISIIVAGLGVYQRKSTSSGLIGVTLSYSIDITGVLSWLIRLFSELESQMVSVERVEEYAQLPSEEDTANDSMDGANDGEQIVAIGKVEPDPSWPQSGDIVFEDVDMRYRKELPLVLSGVSFKIDSGSSVGICGRTGSGKSSLIVALWRLVEPSRGKIFIDGVNISSMPLKSLRSRVTCIPQDPILFSGTIRDNLDPFLAHNDEDLWFALEHVQLKKFVSAHEDGLGLMTPVKEYGSNFSAGQRQMLCLARALLRETKIVCLDEATASVDNESDLLMQKVISQEFKDKTVLTIAHRINTIIESNKVLCMSSGKVLSYDTPAKLLEDPSSIFAQLVLETGEASAKNLKQRANKKILEKQ